MKDAPTSDGVAASRWRALAVRAARKTLWMLLVLWGITLVSFFVIHLAPGTPTDMQTSLNPLAGDMVRERLNALYGLDRPLWEQYADWLGRLVRLDFGISLSSDARPVMEKIMERMPLTVGMNVISLLLTLLISHTHRHRVRGAAGLSARPRAHRAGVSRLCHAELLAGHAAHALFRH